MLQCVSIIAFQLAIFVNQITRPIDFVSSALLKLLNTCFARFSPITWSQVDNENLAGRRKKFDRKTRRTFGNPGKMFKIIQFERGDYVAIPTIHTENHFLAFLRHLPKTSDSTVTCYDGLLVIGQRDAASEKKKRAKESDRSLQDQDPFTEKMNSGMLETCALIDVQ